MFSSLTPTDLPVLRGALAALGCGDSEIKAYEVLLDSGHRPASYIARKVGLNRVYTYDVLSTLEQKGIVYSYEKNSVMHFANLPPKEIVHHLHEQEERLLTMRTELNQIVEQISRESEPSTAIPTFSALRGEDAAAKAIRRLEVAKGDELFILTVDRVYREAAGYKWFDALLNELQTKQATAKIIVNGESAELPQRRLPKKLEAQYCREALVPYQVFISKTSLVLLLEEEQTALVIPNGMFAQLFRWFHTTLWKTL